MAKRVVQIHEKLPLIESIPLSLQHLFAMFGASVLVPILFKINPATVLLMNGIGTLLFIFLTKGKVPSFLGSSFAYLSPAFVVMASQGFQAAQAGFVISGLLLMLIGMLIKYAGFEWIDVHNQQKSILIFCRKAREVNNFLIVLINFQLFNYENFRVGVPLKGIYKEIFNSDQEIYGGNNNINQSLLIAEKVSWHGQTFSITIKVPPLATVIFKLILNS